MEEQGSQVGSDALRVVVFLALLGLIAFHAAAWRAVETLVGEAPPGPQGCQLADRGSIFCLDEAGQSYRAR